MVSTLSPLATPTAADAVSCAVKAPPSASCLITLGVRVSVTTELLPFGPGEGDCPLSFGSSRNSPTSCIRSVSRGN
eukprot:3995438-Pyramimonas_sp.AAC.1